MTIRELYSWARENNVEDYQLHIYCNEDNIETNLCTIDNTGSDNDPTDPTFNNLEIGEYWKHNRPDHPAVWINIAPRIEYTDVLSD